MDEAPGTAPKWEIVAEKTQPHWVELRDPDGWFSASVRFDGCIHFTAHANEPEGTPGRDEASDDYLHICDVDELIARLQELKRMAVTHFGKGWPA